MKKKLVIVLLSTWLCIILAACGGDSTNEDPVSPVEEATEEPEPEPTEVPEPVETEAPEEPEATEAPEETVPDININTELSDDLYSFQVQFNNDVFNLPIKFADLEKMGWVFQDDTSMTLEPYQYLISGTWRMDDDGTRIYTNIINFAPNVLPITDCVVASLSVDEYDLEEGDAFILPKGIQLLVSTEDDIIAAYGEPTELRESESFNYLDYEMNYDQNIEFMIDTETGKLVEIALENMIETEETAQDYTAADINEVPAVVGQYVAPKELGDDFDACTVELDGYLYTLPAPMAEFEKNGWKITDAPDSFVAQDAGFIDIMKGNQSMSVYVRNYGDNETIPANCFVTSISGDDSFDIIIPCGITFGMSDAEVKSVLDKSGADYEVFEETSYTRYYIEGGVGNGYAIVTREGKVDDLEVSNAPKADELFTY